MNIDLQEQVKDVPPFLSTSKAGFLIFLEIILGVVVNLVLLLLFSYLTKKVLVQEIRTLDLSFSQSIYAWRSPFLTQVMYLITNLGSVPVIVLGLIGMIVVGFRKNKKEIAFLLFTFLTGFLINVFLKLIFRISRPDISPLEILTSYSFPSGHAMNSLVFYGIVSYFLYHFTKQLKIGLIAAFLSVVIVTLIGFSRIYLGVHYPSDVISGYLAGFWWLLTCVLFERTLYFYQLFEQFEEKVKK